MTLDSKVLGIVCVVSAVIVFTLQDVTMKWLSGSYALHQIVFVRSIIAMSVTIGIVHLEGGLRIVKSARVGLLLVRGSLTIIANSCYFLALAVMSIAEASAVFFVAPLFITALSALVLKETVGVRRWSAVAVGLAGVVVMLRPGGDTFRLIALLPLLAAGAYAVMQILTRQLGRTEKASTIALYTQFVMLSFSGCMYLVVGDGRYAPDDNASLAFLLREWTIPVFVDGLLLTGIGVLNAIGGYLISQAYRLAQAAVLAPFEYIAMPLGVTAGFVVFGNFPDKLTWVGITLILGSGLYVLHRERVSRQKRG